MKKILLFITLSCLFSISSQAQYDYEFKSDILDFLRNEVKFTGEVVLSNRWGVEVGLGFDFEPKNALENSILANPDNQFSSVFLKTDVGLKYYFLFNKYRGNGLYIGPYTRIGSSLYVQQGYIEKWEELNKREASEWLSTTRGLKSLEFGIISGWKFLIKEKYIIEPGFTYTLDRTIGKGSSDLNFGTVAIFDFTFKTGIRF